ncbi:di-heme-cytochrome C peroxidase [Xanthobacter sp. V3C-3]|uniref:di-heme-cytochrome C peroxidase n=1 Tax=Xanthobacter lutulentifluminis TaxID=3119935 RepID=UPI00372954F4
MQGRKAFILLAGLAGFIGLAAATDAIMARREAAQTAGPPKVLDQGWSQAMREQFYYTPQGSQLLPYTFLRALEQPFGDKPFLDPAHMAQMGFVPADGPSPLNRDALPVGFARDPRPGDAFGPMVGMTCAACHTSDIEAGGVRIRIDGGASQADYQLFMGRLSQALDATLADPAKFQRFAARLVAADQKQVRPALEATAAEIRRLEAVSWSPVPYGRGRLDAFGHILNAVAADALGEPANFRIPDAPVSYPFLWGTPAQRYVQWNGVAGNPLGRNLGEVLGVFGHPSFAGGNVPAFSSTALLDNLVALEAWVATLKPPPWPEKELGKVDATKAKRGAELFAAHCAGCHGGPEYRYTPAAETEGGRQWLAVTMVDFAKVQTDPKMLANFTGRFARPGLLAPLLANAPHLPDGQVPAGAVLLAAVNVITENDLRARGITGDARKAAYGWRFAPGSSAPQSGWLSPAGYKAGPLAGVWATGPFLHNGSVPTIYDLLSPENERPARFYVGSTRLDPARLGFVSTPDELSDKDKASLSLFDTSLPGNSNRGHAFPDPAVARLSPDDRYAIIEYLKILEGPDVRRH